MNKNLPNVYAVPIEKKIKNNEDVFVSGKNVEVGESIPISEIDKIFNSKEHVYKTRVQIKTKTDSKMVDVVGRTSNSLLTLDGQLFSIQDIVEIKKV